MLTSTSVAAATIPYAFEHSDTFVHLIVFLLCGLSVYVWVTIVEKALHLWRVRNNNRRFQRVFRQVSDIRQLQRVVDDEGHSSAMGRVAAAALPDKLAYAGHSAGDTRPAGDSPEQVEPIAARRRMDREVSRQVDELEKGLQLLGTTVTVSPFLGLLGTVWGVMRAFTAMAKAGQPDIQAMAPGVSGALLTTVVGLVVAIPAVFGYNLLTHAVKKHVDRLDDFVDDCMSFFPTHADKD